MKTKNLSTIIFYGAVWGILEATIGYVLHLIPGLSLYVSGSIMFGFATLVLHKAYQQTKSRKSLVFIAEIAAAVKAINFLMPNWSVFKVINPMLSIVMESLALIIVISFVEKDSLWSKISALLVASLAWRLVFFAYMGVDYLAGTTQYIEFFGIYMIASAVLALGFIYLDQFFMNRFKNVSLSPIHPALAWGSLAIAIILTRLSMIL